MTGRFDESDDQRLTSAVQVLGERRDFRRRTHVGKHRVLGIARPGQRRFDLLLLIQVVQQRGDTNTFIQSQKAYLVGTSPSAIRPMEVLIEVERHCRFAHDASLDAAPASLPP